MTSISFRPGPRTLADLGWPQIQAALAERTQTPIGTERARGLGFFESEGEVRGSLTRVGEARSLLARELPIPVGGLEDVRGILARAEKGAMLAALELLSCATVMRAASEVRRFVTGLAGDVPNLGQLAKGLPDLMPLASRIDATFEPSGYLKDDASYELAEYRKRARALHKQIRGQVEEMLKDPPFVELLQDTYHSVRNDRYVLPVKSSFRSQVPGIVHNASQSGQTIFVEPQELVPMGNELAIAESLAAEEERRVLQELSGDVAARADDVNKAAGRLGELDLVQASARLADALEAEDPDVVASEVGFDLRGARHPLLVLQGKSVVPNDIALAESERALVVSGPNAGGKTVTLTTVGLCALLARAGLPIPAAGGSAVPLLEGITCAVGDAQDLAEDLSTFTAHIKVLSDVVRSAGPGWLALVDEIASGTDPREGAALATAVLTTLVEQGTRLVVTTHLDEIKAYGVNDARFVNARVGLDPQSMRPTFRLERGAGVSSAIEVAAHAGLPDAVIARAREHLAEGGSLSLALASLERQQTEARERAEALVAQQRDLELRLAELRQERDTLADERRTIQVEVRRELAQELEGAREAARDIIKKLQVRPTMADAQAAQTTLEEARAQQEAVIEKLAVEAEAPALRAAPGPIGVGDQVKVMNLGQRGEVLEVDGDEAQVAVGSLKTRVKLDGLMRLGGPRPRSAPARRAETPASVAAATPYAPEARLDLRGERGDDAMRKLEGFLDQSYFKGPSLVLIVHGHGSGILKRLVREALSASPYVESARPAERHEGGDGVTVVQLRQS